MPEAEAHVSSSSGRAVWPPSGVLNATLRYCHSALLAVNNNLCLFALQGAPVYNNYGSKPSEELLLAYGFLPHFPTPAAASAAEGGPVFGDSGNPADYFPITLASGAGPGTDSASNGADGRAGAGSTGSAHNALAGDSSMAGGGDSSMVPVDGNSNAQQRPPLQEESREDEEEEAAAAAGEATEQLQRSSVLAMLALGGRHAVTAAEPLPPGLLRAAYICLAPPPLLYLLRSRYASGCLSSPHQPSLSVPIV